ncbi:MAG: hypothetical protein ACN6RK_10225 [Stenotrophomonas sp.]
MSRWTYHFKNQPFHADWAALKISAEALSIGESADFEHAEEIARLIKMVIFISNLIDAMDPEIVNPNILSPLRPYAQNVVGEISNYSSNSNISHLQSANSYLDQILGVAIQNPFSAFGMNAQALREIVTGYSEAMSESATRYETKVQELTKKTVEEYSAVDARSTLAGTSISKLDDRVTAMEAQLPALLAGFNSDFQASEKSRVEKYDSWASNYQVKLDQQFSTAAAKFGAGELTMGGYLDQAGKILGSVVDTAQAGAYATYASEEKKSANRFRFFALMLMAGAALVLFLPELVHAAKAAANYEMDWKAAIYRIPFSIILFAPAVYLAKESTKHRGNEVVNRRRQHILTTIGPYLALLDAGKAQDIKAEVARSIFSDTHQAVDDKSPETVNVLAQITSLVDLLLKRRPG